MTPEKYIVAAIFVFILGAIWRSIEKNFDNLYKKVAELEKIVYPIKGRLNAEDSKKEP